MSFRLIAVPMGDPAGVGPEIVLKAMSAGGKMWRKDGNIPLVTGDMSILEEVRRRLDIPVKLVDVSNDGIQNLEDLPDDTVAVADVGTIKKASDIEVGKVSALSGKASVSYIRKAVELCMNGRTLGIATTPINKEALKAGGFHYIGHTEMLAEMSGAEKSYTMFMVGKLKIFFHSRHLSLMDAIRFLDTEGVADSIVTAGKCLESIGEGSGTVALAALNPHASDGGLFGSEEKEILIPAVNEARGRGINAVGPVPADSVFYFGLQGKYDIVVSLYHDQGHIASKTYDFYRTVSVTFGLPFIRTSVDHGTAFDIAWKGIANPVSMEEAIRACFELAPRYRPF